ncbi:MAG: hypothetical protein AAF720_01420 [Pseudomonadota bacterium]
MTKKLSDIEISETMIRALNDLERIEFEFSINEPSAKKIEGRLVAFMREKGDTEQ